MMWIEKDAGQDWRTIRMTTRKKLEGNGLWESNRMMLPEHKEAIIRQQHEEGRKAKPTPDSQELE